MKANSNYENLHLFPLPSQILPQGMMQLRIIELQHIKLVINSLKKHRGFGVVTSETQAPNCIGTRVEIVDFYPLEGGILGITVQGKERFEVKKIKTQAEGLLIAEVRLLPNWEDDISSVEHSLLAIKLNDIFTHYPQLDKLYKIKQFEDLAWLCQRWLEILPMTTSQKQDLISQSSYNKTLKHLNHMMAV